MTDLSQRYAGPSRSTRVAALVLTGLLALAGVCFVGWTFLAHSTPEVQSRLTYFDFPSEHSAQAQLTVVRDEEGTAASCVLTVLAEDHSVVGQETVEVTSGELTQSVPVRIRTERRGTSVDSEGCTTPDQARPR